MPLRDLLNSLDLNENLTSFENQNEVIARFCFGLSGRRYHLVDLIPMILFVVFLNGRFSKWPFSPTAIQELDEEPSYAYSCSALHKRIENGEGLCGPRLIFGRFSYPCKLTFFTKSSQKCLTR